MLQDPGDELNTKMTVENNMSISEQYYMVTAVTDEFPRTTMTNTETMESTAMTCRVCATATQHFIPIFMGEGLVHQLCDKIQKYLPIEVKETDKLPLQMCFHCTTTLLAWHEISEGCLNAQQRLHQMQAQLEEKQSFYNSHTLETVDTATEAILQDEFVEQAVLEISQEFETDVIETKGGMEISDQILDLVPTVSPEIGESILTEIICEETSQVLSPLNVMPCTPTETTKVETEAFNSDELNRSDSVESPEKTNLEKQESKDRSTEKSKDETAWLSFADLAQMQRWSDLTQTPSELQKVRNEESSEKKDPVYQCEECGRAFKLKDSYNRHLRIHKDERPFTCHVCGKQFRDSGGLSRHLKDVHAKVKNFSCDICGRRFASRATRDDHQRIHTGERPYVCDVCGKAFKSKASLYTHSKLHTDDFPHSCNYCKKKFRRKQEVLAHVTTHTGEKNFQCDICSKRFRVKSELVRHQRVHSDDKPFMCTVCGFAFRQKRYLNNHVKSRHADTLQPS